MLRLRFAEDSFIITKGDDMKLQFNVTGMTCAACSARVEKVSAAVAGVEKAEVNLLKGTCISVIAVLTGDTLLNVFKSKIKKNE